MKRRRRDKIKPKHSWEDIPNPLHKEHRHNGIKGGPFGGGKREQRRRRRREEKREDNS